MTTLWFGACADASAILYIYSESRYISVLYIHRTKQTDTKSVFGWNESKLLGGGGAEKA